MGWGGSQADNRKVRSDFTESRKVSLLPEDKWNQRLEFSRIVNNNIKLVSSSEEREDKGVVTALFVLGRDLEGKINRESQSYGKGYRVTTAKRLRDQTGKVQARTVHYKIGKFENYSW